MARRMRRLLVQVKRKRGEELLRRSVIGERKSYRRSDQRFRTYTLTRKTSSTTAHGARPVNYGRHVTRCPKDFSSHPLTYGQGPCIVRNRGAEQSFPSQGRHGCAKKRIGLRPALWLSRERGAALPKRCAFMLLN